MLGWSWQIHRYLLSKILFWYLADQQFINQNSQTPQINLFSIRLTVNYFRSHIILRTNKCISLTVKDIWWTKIRQFTLAILGDKNILWLNVSMENWLLTGMQIFDGFDNVSEIFYYLGFRQSLILFELLEKCTSFCVLEE